MIFFLSLFFSSFSGQFERVLIRPQFPFLLLSLLPVLTEFFRVSDSIDIAIAFSLDAFPCKYVNTNPLAGLLFARVLSLLVRLFQFRSLFRLYSIDLIFILLQLKVAPPFITLTRHDSFDMKLT
jgi:hypothetical protein